MTRTNLPFRADPIPHIDRFHVTRGVDTAADCLTYFDDIRLTTDPVSEPVTADLAAGGATTLQVVNLPAAWSWPQPATQAK